MRFRAFIALAATVMVAACGDTPTPLNDARKETLRKTLDAKFLTASVGRENEEDFFRILAAFSETRRADEYVTTDKFDSSDSATLSFSDSGMHGGGIAIAKKTHGKWTIDQKLHFM